jgi:hypothetical protein
MKTINNIIQIINKKLIKIVNALANNRIKNKIHKVNKKKIKIIRVKKQRRAIRKNKLQNLN